MIRTEKIVKEFYVLTNDPSVTGWGWAVLNKKGIVMEAGCIKTEPDHKKKRIRKGDDNVRRVSDITRTLKEVIEKYDIDYILSELPHGSQNANAAMMMGMTLMLQAISDVLSIPAEWYSEQDAKKAVLGKKSATKQEMIDKIKTHYSYKFTGVKYKDEAVADALAIHYVAMQQSQTLKLFLKQ